MSVKRVEIKLRLNSFYQFICILHKNQNKHFTQGWHSKPVQKTRPIESATSGYFLIFNFLRYLKHFISIILIVIVFTEHITL